MLDDPVPVRSVRPAGPGGHCRRHDRDVLREGRHHRPVPRDSRQVRRGQAHPLACSAIACNLLRAAGALASLAYARARGATLRRDLINVAVRTTRHGRGHITLHLPEGWHREHEWLTLLAACGPPAAAA